MASGSHRIAVLRENAKIAQDILAALADMAQPGVSTSSLDDAAESLMAQRGCEPAFRGYAVGRRIYPSSICTSLNGEVMHGLPGRGHVLKDGDLLLLDVGIKRSGFYADLATTIVVGRAGPSEAQHSIIECAFQALKDGIGMVCAGNHVGAISWAMRQRARASGFSVVGNLAGHGIGSALHEWPVLDALYGVAEGPVLRDGDVLCVEAILTDAPGDVVLADVIEDGWTMVVPRATVSAHFEAMVLATDRGPEVLGSWPVV